MTPAADPARFFGGGSWLVTLLLTQARREIIWLRPSCVPWSLKLTVRGIKPAVAKTSLQTASIYCLVVWAALWCLFMLIRFTHLDIRIIPVIGPVMLMALVIAVLAPVMAIGIAGTAIIRQPRVTLNWLMLGCAFTALVGEAFLFAATRWL